MGLSKDGIVRTIIVGVIVAAVGGAGTASLLALGPQLGLTAPGFASWLKDAFRLLTDDVTLPRWCFWLWAAMSLVVIGLVVVRIYFDLASPAWLRYRSDVLFGLRWKWNLSANGAVQYPPRMFCPKCDHQFNGAEFSYAELHENSRVWRIACETCGYEGKVPMATDLPRKVKAEVERRIRTGEWKQTT
jgi:hypothetical protein